MIEHFVFHGCYPLGRPVIDVLAGQRSIDKTFKLAFYFVVAWDNLPVGFTVSAFHYSLVLFHTGSQSIITGVHKHYGFPRDGQLFKVMMMHILVLSLSGLFVNLIWVMLIPNHLRPISSAFHIS